MIFVGQSSCFYTQIFFTLALQYSRGGKFFREQFGGKNFRENILQNFVKITVKHMCLNLFSINTTSESIFFFRVFSKDGILKNNYTKMHKQYSFFYLDFISRTFTIHRAARDRGGHCFKSSLPLLPASLTLRHQSGNFCKELTYSHTGLSNSNREFLVSKRKSLTTKLRDL